jgi:transposase
MKFKGRPSKRPSRYEFEREYYKYNRTAKDLAKEWGVSESTIYRWQREFRENRGGVDKKRILSA